MKMIIINYGQTDFAEIFINLTRYRSENNLLNLQNNYLEDLMIMLQKILTF